jgi:hypothetical protein
MHGEDQSLILKTAKQLASGLMRAIVTANGLTKDQRDLFRQREATIHFHDWSPNEIAWNDVQAIIMHNELTERGPPGPDGRVRGVQPARPQ